MPSLLAHSHVPILGPRMQLAVAVRSIFDDWNVKAGITAACTSARTCTLFLVKKSEKKMNREQKKQIGLWEGRDLLET